MNFQLQGNVMVACPGMRQGAAISALIKPIGLYGTQKAPKNFRTRPTVGGGVKNCRSGPKFFFELLGYPRAQLV